LLESGTTWSLLSIIFDHFILAWGIVKTVTPREVQDLLTLAYLSEGIEEQDQKPIP